MLAGLTACGVPSSAGEPEIELTELAARVEGGASWVVVAARVEGLAEDGGRCRFTFWAANGAASRLTATGVADRGGTRCGPVSEEIGRIIPVGSYELGVRYESESTSLASDRVPVSVAVDEVAW